MSHLLASNSSYDAGMRPMMMSSASAAYPAAGAGLPPPAAHARPLQSRQPDQYREDFRTQDWEHRTQSWDSRTHNWDSRAWDSRAAAPEQDHYPAPATQRVLVAPTSTQRVLMAPASQDECAEEECLDADQCGADHRPPKPENLVCGVDTRPLLPIGLAISTVIGALLMILLQIPLLSRLANLPEGCASLIFLVLCAVTLGCMTCAAFYDPGQLRKDRSSRQDFGSGSEEAPLLPRRAYKSWQYKRAVRRYDHYCRWLSNCIGLLNHREFFVMLVGLVLIGVVGLIVDLIIGICILAFGWIEGFWHTELLVVLHLAYSVGLMALAFPILRIHTGLVSRNEMAAEWKRNDFYVAKNSKRGKDIPVNELSDDEYNSLFDSFVYDKSRNTFDHGWQQNCFRFWCLARWPKEELGEW